MKLTKLLALITLLSFMTTSPARADWVADSSSTISYYCDFLETDFTGDWHIGCVAYSPGAVLWNLEIYGTMRIELYHMTDIDCYESVPHVVQENKDDVYSETESDETLRFGWYAVEGAYYGYQGWLYWIIQQYFSSNITDHQIIDDPVLDDNAGVCWWI